jgi:hypothetical protein
MARCWAGNAMLKPDPAQQRALCTRGDRPRRRAAEKRDELTTLQSIELHPLP